MLKLSWQSFSDKPRWDTGPTLRCESSHVTVFPLKGEAITFKVKGPQSRDQEVVKVLDDSIQSFVNLKPYIVGVEQADSGTTTVFTILFEYLLPAAIAALVIIWMLRLQNSSVKH